MASKASLAIVPPAPMFGGGIDELFNETGVTQARIPLDLIDVRKQIREDFGDDETRATFEASVREHGVFQPILLRRMEEGRYLLVAGERRLRASKAVGLTDIPALIRTMDDEEHHRVQLAENIHRENLTLREEAAALQADYTRLGSQDEVAKLHGKTVPWVSKRLSLLSLPPEAAEIVRRNISADIEVITGVATVAKKDAKLAAEVVTKLGATKGKSDARKIVETAKAIVKPPRVPKGSAVASPAPNPVARSATGSAISSHAPPERGQTTGPESTVRANFASNDPADILEQCWHDLTGNQRITAAQCWNELPRSRQQQIEADFSLWAQKGKEEVTSLENAPKTSAGDAAAYQLHLLREGDIDVTGAGLFRWIALLHGMAGDPLTPKGVFDLVRDSGVGAK